MLDVAALQTAGSPHTKDRVRCKAREPFGCSVSFAKALLGVIETTRDRIRRAKIAKRPSDFIEIAAPPRNFDGAQRELLALRRRLVR